MHSWKALKFFWQGDQWAVSSVATAHVLSLLLGFFYSSEKPRGSFSKTSHETKSEMNETPLGSRGQSRLLCRLALRETKWTGLVDVTVRPAPDQHHRVQWCWRSASESISSVSERSPNFIVQMRHQADLTSKIWLNQTLSQCSCKRSKLLIHSIINRLINKQHFFFLVT